LNYFNPSTSKPPQNQILGTTVHQPNEHAPQSLHPESRPAYIQTKNMVGNEVNNIAPSNYNNEASFNTFGKPEPPQMKQFVMDGSNDKGNGWQISSTQFLPIAPQNPMQMNQESYGIQPCYNQQNHYFKSYSFGGFKEPAFNYPPEKSSYHPPPRSYNKNREDKQYRYTKTNYPEKERSRKNKPTIHPNFQSTFKPLKTSNFDLNSVKPGEVSKKLSDALGMKSNKEAPPYLANLIKVGIPNYCKKRFFHS